MKEKFVSLHPERDPVKFIFILNSYPGPEVKVTVDFIRDTFIYYEWHFGKRGNITHVNRRVLGNVADFKKKLLLLDIWEWEQLYQTDGIIVDGKEWSVVLETKNAIFKSEGLNCFPKDWRKMCRAISKLTGIPIT